MTGTGTPPVDRLVAVNGIRLHYLDWGNDTAPAMVLVHGTASHAHVWDRFAAAMRDEYHVVALDQRGHGDSDAAPDHETGYGPESWVDDLAGFIDELALAPVTLIGLSAGGNTAMHYTAAHPEAVRELVIVEMGPQAAREGADRVRASIPAQEAFATEDEALAYLTRSAGRADPELAREHARHAIRRVGSGRVVLKGDPNLRRRDWRRPLRTADENWSAAHSVRRPTLLVRGGDSKLLAPEVAERMAREMADTTLVTIAGAGHSVPLHKPAEFEATVRAWLARRATAG